MATSENKTRYSYTITNKTDKTVADAITDGVNSEGSFPKLVNGLLYRCWAYEGDERAARVRDAVEYLADKSIKLGGNDDAENVFRKMLDTMDKESGYSDIPEALRPKIPEMTIDEHTLIEIRDDIINTIGKVLNDKVMAAGGDTHELELINANKAMTENQDIMDRLNALMDVVNKYDATGETTLHMLTTIKKAAIDISGKASLEIARNKKIIDADKKAKEAERKRLAALEAEAKRQADEAEAIARRKRIEAEQAAMKRKLAEEAKARQLERERLEKERAAKKIEEEKLAKARREKDEKEKKEREEAERIAKQKESSHRRSFTEEFAAINNDMQSTNDNSDDLDDGDLLSFLIGAVNDPGFINGKLGVDGNDDDTAIQGSETKSTLDDILDENEIDDNNLDIDSIIDDLEDTQGNSPVETYDDVELEALPNIEFKPDDDGFDDIIGDVDFDGINANDLFDDDEQDESIIESPKKPAKSIKKNEDDAFKNTDTMSFTAMFCKTGDNADDDEANDHSDDTNAHGTERTKHRKSHAKSGKSYLYDDYSDRSFAPADMNIETWKPTSRNNSLFD